MKKTIFLVLACVSVLLTSCEKDYTKVDNLSGTTWKCSDIGDVEYALFVFTSTNSVEFWVKSKGEPEYQNGIFSYSVYTNRIHFIYEDETVITGLIDKNTITATIEDETGVFIKQ
jgi:hypothetical protein